MLRIPFSMGTEVPYLGKVGFPAITSRISVPLLQLVSLCFYFRLWLPFASCVQRKLNLPVTSRIRRTHPPLRIYDYVIPRTTAISSVYPIGLGLLPGLQSKEKVNFLANECHGTAIVYLLVHKHTTPSL